MASLLHPFINMVVQKSSEAVIKQCTLMIGVNEEREKLHLKLLTIENMLVDADERSGTGQGKSMKAWLAKLKKVAYEADDVLDDFQYEAIKKEVEVEMPGYAITKSFIVKLDVFDKNHTPRTSTGIGKASTVQPTLIPLWNSLWSGFCGLF